MTNPTTRLWNHILEEAASAARSEPLLASMLHETLLSHRNFAEGLSFLLATKLESPVLKGILLRELIHDAYKEDPGIVSQAVCDLEAVVQRDPAAGSYFRPFLFFKGFHVLQAYRVAHWLWKKNRTLLASYFQSKVSEQFAVDIHPAARIGCGIMMDHGTGIVIGETAVVEDNVSLLHEVTLGGTGKETGDRHPKVREGVLIGAGAKILGNIEIGKGAKIGAGSVVLKPVPAHTVVAGVPAKGVGRSDSDDPALTMDHELPGDFILDFQI